MKEEEQIQGLKNGLNEYSNIWRKKIKIKWKPLKQTCECIRKTETAPNKYLKIYVAQVSINIWEIKKQNRRNIYLQIGWIFPDSWKNHTTAHIKKRLEQIRTCKK